MLPGVDELQVSFANVAGDGFSNGLGGGIYAIKDHPYPVIKANDWVRDSATGKVIVDPVSGMPSVNSNATIFVKGLPWQR